MTRNNSLRIGTTKSPHRILDYWASYPPTNIQIEINSFLQRISIKDMEIFYEENEKNEVVRNTVTYNIYPDAKWSDGKNLTSRDYEFWLRIKKNPKVPLFIREPWNNANFKYLSEKSFQLTFEPAYLFVEKTAPLAAPLHKLNDSWVKTEKLIQDSNDSTTIRYFWEEWLNSFTLPDCEDIVSNGLFQIHSWEEDNIVLTRNEKNQNNTTKEKDYNSINTIEYKFYKNIEQMQALINQDELDVISAPDLTVDILRYISSDKKNDFKVEMDSTYAWEHIDLNLFPNSNSNLLNKSIRQALLYSIDKKRIMKDLYNGEGDTSDSFVHWSSELFDTNIKKYNYSPRKSLNLLESEGWKINKDGILEKNGHEMTFRFSTTEGDYVRNIVQSIIVENFRTIGIKINVENLPTEYLLSKNFLHRGSEGSFELLMFAWVEDPTYEKGELYTAQNSNGQNIPTIYNDFDGQNINGWENVEYTKLFKQAQNTFDKHERNRIFCEMQKIWAEELPSLPLFYRQNIRVINKSLHGFSSNLNERNLNAIYWK